MAKKQKDLTQIIRDNPDCIAIVDNDCWFLYSKEYVDVDDKEYADKFLLAQSGEVMRRGDGGYGSGNCYGGDILQALAQIVGITVESV